MVTKINHFELTDSTLEGYGICNGKEVKIISMPYTREDILTIYDKDSYQTNSTLCTFKISHDFLKDMVQLFNHSLNVLNDDSLKE